VHARVLYLDSCGTRHVVTGPVPMRARAAGDAHCIPPPHSCAPLPFPPVPSSLSTTRAALTPFQLETLISHPQPQQQMMPQQPSGAPPMLGFGAPLQQEAASPAARPIGGRKRTSPQWERCTGSLKFDDRSELTSIMQRLVEFAFQCPSPKNKESQGPQYRQPGEPGAGFLQLIVPMTSQPGMKGAYFHCRTVRGKMISNPLIEILKNALGDCGATSVEVQGIKVKPVEVQGIEVQGIDGVGGSCCARASVAAEAAAETVPQAHEEGLEYGDNAADIAADNMAATFAAKTAHEEMKRGSATTSRSRSWSLRLSQSRAR